MKSTSLPYTLPGKPLVTCNFTLFGGCFTCRVCPFFSSFLNEVIFSFCPFNLCWCHWCLSSACSSQHWSSCQRLWRPCWDAQLISSASSSSAKPPMSLAKPRLVIVLPKTLTVPLWSSKTSIVIISRNMLKRPGESRHPCRNPTVVWDQSPMMLLKRTSLVALS